MHHPLVVLPREAGALARRAEALRPARRPVAGEGVLLMAQNWRYSSRKARRELGYRARPLDSTLRDTIDWYQRADRRRRASGRPAARRCRWPPPGVRLAGRAGLLGGLRAGRALHGPAAAWSGG